MEYMEEKMDSLIEGGIMERDDLYIKINLLEQEIESLQNELEDVKAESARYKSSLENVCADFTWSLSAAKKEARRGLEG